VPLGYAFANGSVCSAGLPPTLSFRLARQIIDIGPLHVAHGGRPFISGQRDLPAPSDGAEIGYPARGRR
jgi:hypothetical protein